jgi:steroid delta-isomerase-like uncharacterized protein
MKKVLLLFVSAAGFMAACNDAGKADNAKEKMGGDSAMVAGASSNMEDKAMRNKKVIMASFDAMASHNVADMLKDCATDCVDYGDGSMPPVKGKDSIMKMLQSWMNAFPDSKGDNLKYVAEGDWVMVWGDWTGTFKNDFMGMKATNKSYRYPDVDIFKMSDDGKVMEHHNVQSFNMVMMQVGAMSPKK